MTGLKLDVRAGQVFGRLTVLEQTRLPPAPSEVRRGKSGARGARCQCECGRETMARIYDLLCGNIRSCGCLRRERCRERSTVHGYGARAGAARHPLYGLWLNMKNRCENPNLPSFKNYGGRGIKVCERWQKFPNFLADVGERPPGLTLDRIDNEGDYEPGNVKWSTRAEQRANRRSYTSMVAQLRLQLRLHLLTTGNNWPAVVD